MRKQILVVSIVYLASCGPNYDPNNPVNTKVESPAEAKTDNSSGSSSSSSSNTGTESFCAVQKIFDNNCISCHSDQGARPALTASKIANTVSNSEYVKAGNAEQSEIYLRVNSDSQHFRMPRGAEKLSAADIATIKTWIEDGAKSTCGSSL
jgi:uncharacterized membrane protein